MEKSYINLKTVTNKNGEIEFSADIPVTILDVYEKKVLAETAQHFQMPGFRKGKVPSDIIRENIDAIELFETAAEKALRDVIREIITDENLKTVGTPELRVVTMSPKNPISFTVRFALLPEVALPDYKKIAHDIFTKEEEVKVSDEDLGKSIDELRKMMAQAPAPEGGEPNPLPELTDEFVKQFGDFKSVEAFREELKNQMLKEKALRVKDEKRDKVIKEIVKHAKIEIPPMLVSQEWAGVAEDRKIELERTGMTFEDYLKEIKKTEKELEKEEREFLESQIRTGMVFREIQKQENIQATDREIASNAAYLKVRYPERDDASLRRTAEAFILQEKVFEILTPKSETEEKEKTEKEAKEETES